MKTLIVYDSYFGNTEKIAMAVSKVFENQGSVIVCRAADVKSEELAGLDYLLVGSPTRGFRASDATNVFLNNLPASALKDVKTAAFDTRIAIKDINNPLLNLLARFFGFAADPISKQLTRKGGISTGTSEGFFVMDSKGPLKDGELERAAQWAGTLLNA